MADEAVIIELLGNQGDPIRFTCADGATIEKGTLMEVTDPRTVVKVSGANTALVGIAAAEKVANDGATTIAVYTNGIFDLTISASGITTLGFDVVANAGDNKVEDFDTLDGEKGYAIGKSLESGGNNEVVAVRVLK